MRIKTKLSALANLRAFTKNQKRTMRGLSNLIKKNFNLIWTIQKKLLENKWKCFWIVIF